MDDKASRVRLAERSRRAVSAPAFARKGAGRSLVPSRPVHLDGKQQPRILGQRCILEYNQTRKREGGRKTELRNKSKMPTRKKNSSPLRSGVEGVIGGEAVGGPPPLGRRHCCANHSRRLALLRDPASFFARRATPSLLLPLLGPRSDAPIRGGKTSAEHNPTPNAGGPSDARRFFYLALHATLGFPSL